MSAGKRVGEGPGTEGARWLRYAREDLQTAAGLAELALSPARHSCWLAQQGAEKALKGLLVLLGIGFPRTHDLDLLRTLIPDGYESKTDPADVSALSEWSVEARYPGLWPEATAQDSESAITCARAVLAAVERDFLASGFSDESDGG